LPYLFPFLMGLAILEDIGYLPRIAFLMDSLMHKIGLHGTAVIPAILGYGCSVPAIMATRILRSPRDRFIASMIALTVPCSARMTVILGLVGFYLGGIYAFAIYLLNIIIVALLATVLAHILPENDPGMILEMPAYQVPKIKVIFSKVWLRSKEFILVAWPVLIIGSIILSYVTYLGWNQKINVLLSPLTILLGLPVVVGMTLVFGVLRKELSLIMLVQALGTTEVLKVMTASQILVYTVFIVFYFPCIATFGILLKEIGLRKSIFASLITLGIAVATAYFLHIILSIYHF
jgi:ferrous iron transport protein B